MRKLLLSALVAGLLAPANTQTIKIVPDEAHRRVDVTVDGAPFTSYQWPETQKKPVLYPLIAPGGVEVSRGYPLAPRPGERTDHPHHAGMWFSYGNVNGFDFWNNSEAIKPEDGPKMGTIHHTRVVSVKNEGDRAELVTEAIWTTGKGDDVLAQTSHYVFHATPRVRTIDETVTLRALQDVVFNDDKEGLLGLRVAHFLESADEKGGTFTDAQGRPTTVDTGNPAGATGVYRTSEGKIGGAAWGTRGDWCVLTGNNGADTVSIAIMDHPGNPNFPTFWHARGYGLFAANPLGQHIFDPKASALNLKLTRGKSIIFQHRVLLLAGEPSVKEMVNYAADFAADK